MLPLTLYSQSRRSSNLDAFGGFETACGWKVVRVSIQSTPTLDS